LSVEISGLDITLQRINAIERDFKAITGQLQAPDKDFQSILDTSVKANAGDSASKSEVNGLIDEYSQKNRLDSDFVRAVVKQESGFNSNATSKVGALGLMQLMPSTAKGLGVRNPFDAEQNIAGGTKYLKNLINKYDSVKLGLAAYNAGSGAVAKYGGVPPYRETQNYVKKIMDISGETE